MSNAPVVIGEGTLNWRRGERVSDRYGTVVLTADGDPFGDAMTLQHVMNRARGRLLAEVLETRESDHIGDLFHGVFPKAPKVGERIVLGEGILFYDEGTNVGLKPTDGRKSLWLDIKALYRAHSQIVRLIFEPAEDAGDERVAEATEKAIG